MSLSYVEEGSETMAEVVLPAPSSLPKCPEHPAYSIPEGGKCPVCDWDPAAQLEPVTPTEVMVTEKFEGSDVVEWEMSLPKTIIECDRSFKRGSVIRMAVEVRIRNVGYVERKDGSLTRVHQATLEDISVISAFDPSQNHENVGGNLAGTAPDEPDDDTEANPLGDLQAGRTQDTWPPAPDLLEEP